MTSPQRKIEHHYVDHANDDARPAENGTGNSSSNNNNNSITYAHLSDRTFPVTLHFMLNELKSDGLDQIISWQPHGRCFVVHKQTQFVEKILPMWFRQSKFASFQRQLNLYGFKRLTLGHDKGGYYHELFLRGKPHLANKIPRIKLKNDGARKSTSPETEPNFYAYPFLPDDPPNTTASTMTTTAASDRNSTTASTVTSLPSPTPATATDSLAAPALATYGCTSNGTILENTDITLARMAESVNVLRLNQNLDQLRNLELYSRLMPAITGSPSSTNANSNASNVDLVTRLLNRDALNNMNENITSQLLQARNPVGQVPAMSPLQRLLVQNQLAQPTTSASVVPNSVLSLSSSSSSSILDAALIALVQQQQQQRLATLLSTLLSNNTTNANNANNISNDLLILRLAISHGYSSVDQFLRDVAALSQNSIVANVSNRSTSTLSTNNIIADFQQSKPANN